MSRAAFILLAAGQGTRMQSPIEGQSPPKQMMRLKGRRVIDWSLEMAHRSGFFDNIILVWPPAEKRTADWAEWKVNPAITNLTYIEGGEDRTASVRAGMKALEQAPPDFVFIHDSARPGLNVKILEMLFTALDDASYAAPILPVIDALKDVGAGGNALKSVERDRLRRVQTPQAFHYAVLHQALQAGGSFDDDLSAVNALGRELPFKSVEGDERLRKLTFPDDKIVLEAILTPPAETPISLPAMRIGNGFDVHAFGPGAYVTLCGIEIPHAFGLAGHSDADVAWHALTDAILGALALGDIGDHFPPSDPKWRGVASEVFLSHALSLVCRHDYYICNIDITLICEAPKIFPHRAAMRANTARVLGLSEKCVSIKATTTEKLGFTGRREGIAAQASVLVAKSER